MDLKINIIYKGVIKMSEKSNPCNPYPECSDCQNEISCYKKIAGVLSDAEIRELRLIPKANGKNYNPTIYDLSLGAFHYVYGTSRNTNTDNKTTDNKKTWLPICIGTKKELNDENKGFPEDEQFVRQDRSRTTVLTIPALGSALIQLDEIVDTYSVAKSRNVLVTGRFDLKLGLVNKGLISQQGTQIEPCYKGRLYCFIHNLSNRDIELKRGEPIASIEFSYVSCFCDAKKRKEVIDSLIDKNEKDERYLSTDYCDEGKGILNVRYFNRRKLLPDSCGLSHITETAVKAVQEQNVIKQISDNVKKEVERKHELLIRIGSAILIPLIVALLGFYASIHPLENKYEKLQETVQSQQEIIEDLKEQLDELESKINSNSKSVE